MTHKWKFSWLSEPSDLENPYLVQQTESWVADMCSSSLDGNTGNVACPRERTGEVSIGFPGLWTGSQLTFVSMLVFSHLYNV